MERCGYSALPSGIQSLTNECLRAPPQRATPATSANISRQVYDNATLVHREKRVFDFTIEVCDLSRSTPMAINVQPHADVPAIILYTLPQNVVAN